MKVHIFNHWFKYKVPIDDHIDRIKDSIINDSDYHVRFSNLWYWLDEKHDVGQYYNWRESRNYLCFNSEHDYLIFLLKL